MLSGLLLGALLGFVLQRGRFCVTGAFRDIYLNRNYRMFTAFLIAISIQSLGIFVLSNFGLFSSPVKSLAPFAVIIGAFLFGVGIVLAGGCATGTWYRAGEGLLGSWVALFVYALTSAVMRTGPLNHFNSELKSYTVQHTTIYDSLNISPWLLVLLLISVTGYLAYHFISKEKGLTVASLPPRKTGINHLLFEKRWHPFVTAILLGLIAILAWPLSNLTGRNFGLGITTPSANLIQFLVTGNSQYINWGVFLVLGILLGSFLAAKGANEFRLRAPDSRTLVTSAIGGFTMGVGASLAGGCSIGNGLVHTAIFSWQGWISLPVMMLGTWSASYLLFVQSRKVLATNLA